MSIIGGRIGQKKDQNFTHRITVQGDDGSRSNLNFYTLRHARNYLREHPFANVIGLWKISDGTQLALDPGAP